MLQYFNADVPTMGHMLTKVERDSLLGLLRGGFGRGVSPNHREPKENDYGTALAARLYEMLSNPRWHLRRS